ncbi:hypothetical protein FRX31_019076 [Thalictrum thalictroides]|uniref:Uncharacterized protein n=1 Tax=Thalictrum thalictroides TaxID=46969 RepID=A0A7J6W2B0_THATH|nr:hypothetical protein FRX31_019076 [Thalictrum thalictroides]
MGDNGRIDIEKCISYSRDLAEVLKNKKDANHLMQSLEWAKRLQSYCEADYQEVKNSLLDYQKRINACKQRIDEAKAEVLSDKDLDSLENELEEEQKKGSLLMEELR